MRRLLLALALLAVNAPPAAALDPSKAHRTPGCKVRGSVTVVKFRQARIFRDRRDTANAHVFGCLYRRGVSRYMTSQLDDTDRALTRAAGTLVAYPQDDPSITLFDLRDGSFADFYAGRLTDVALRADGTLGWIEDVGVGDHQLRVGRFTPPFKFGVEASPPPLATGPGIGPTSLVFHRPGVYWTDGGRVHGAAYPGL